MTENSYPGADTEFQEKGGQGGIEMYCVRIAHAKFLQPCPLTIADSAQLMHHCNKIVASLILVRQYYKSGSIKVTVNHRI